MLHIGWTTLPDRAAAERLAQDAVEAGLVACAQVDAPILSIYRWEGRIERSEEVRVWLKFPAENGTALGRWLAAHHPYDTPQWIVVEAVAVAEKCLSWAQAVRLPPPL